MRALATILGIRCRRTCPVRGQDLPLLQSSIFSPLTLPSLGLRQCEGRKNAAPTYHRRYPIENSSARTHFLAASGRVEITSTTFYPCRPWQRPVNSLLHAPAGDPV